VRGNESIKKISGKTRARYRSPAWDLSPHSIELLLKHGIKYDSSLMGHDYDCYYARKATWRSLRHRSCAAARPTWSRCRSAGRSTTSALRIHGAIQRLDPGRPDECDERAGELRRRLHLHDARGARFRHPDYTFHPHVIGRGHRHDDAGAFDPEADGGRRRVHDHGSRPARVAGAPPGGAKGGGRIILIGPLAFRPRSEDSLRGLLRIPVPAR